MLSIDCVTWLLLQEWVFCLCFCEIENAYENGGSMRCILGMVALSTRWPLYAFGHRHNHRLEGPSNGFESCRYFDVLVP